MSKQIYLSLFAKDKIKIFLGVLKSFSFFSQKKYSLQISHQGLLFSQNIYYYNKPIQFNQPCIFFLMNNDFLSDLDIPQNSFSEIMLQTSLYKKISAITSCQKISIIIKQNLIKFTFFTQTCQIQVQDFIDFSQIKYQHSKCSFQKIFNDTKFYHDFLLQKRTEFLNFLNQFIKQTIIIPQNNKLTILILNKGKVFKKYEIFSYENITQKDAHLIKNEKGEFLQFVVDSVNIKKFFKAVNWIQLFKMGITYTFNHNAIISISSYQNNLVSFFCQSITLSCNFNKHFAQSEQKIMEQLFKKQLVLKRSRKNQSQDEDDEFKYSSNEITNDSDKIEVVEGSVLQKLFEQSLIIKKKLKKKIYEIPNMNPL